MTNEMKLTNKEVELNEEEIVLKNKEIIEELKYKRNQNVKSTVHNKTSNCMYSACLKKYTDIYLYTSQGYTHFDEFVFSTIKVEGTYGVQEFIVGTILKDAYEIINALLEHEVAFEELGEYMEERRNYDAIDNMAEKLIR